jgi:hypothetical protein
VFEADINRAGTYYPPPKSPARLFIVPRKQAAETLRREAHGLMDAHGDEEITEVLKKVRSL